MTDIHPSFEQVHDSQMIYRKLLDCMARPGKIQTIRESIGKIEGQKSFSHALLALAVALIDREVTFHLLPEGNEDIARYLRWTTWSTPAAVEQADFLFIDGPLEDDAIRQVMAEVKIGTLLEPHKSATLVIHVSALSVIPDLAVTLDLQGPGIKGKAQRSVSGLPAAWLIERDLANKEYPLGVDMILVTESGDMMALPRTTSIESECF